MSKAVLITRDYQGMTFVFREDGYFNMTKAAKAFGKRLDNFFANNETLDYTNELEKLVPGIPVLKVTKGNGASPSVGTWGHPKLAVFFARWLDVKFAVFCDTVIDDILSKKASVTFTPQAAAPALAKSHLDTARELVAALEQSERLLQENARLQHQVDHITIREYERNLRLYLSPSQKGRMARHANAYCLQHNLVVTKAYMQVEKRGLGRGEMVNSPINVYPRAALDAAADAIGVSF